MSLSKLDICALVNVKTYQWGMVIHPIMWILLERYYINPYEWWYDHATILGYTGVHVPSNRAQYSQNVMADYEYGSSGNFSDGNWPSPNEMEGFQQKHRRIHGFSSYGVAEG